MNCTQTAPAWAHGRCSVTTSQQVNKCLNHPAGQAGRAVRLREVRNLPPATQLDMEPGFRPRSSCPWVLSPSTSRPPLDDRRLPHKQNGGVFWRVPSRSVQVVASGERTLESAWGQARPLPLKLEALATADAQRGAARCKQGLRSSRHEALRTEAGTQTLQDSACRVREGATLGPAWASLGRLLLTLPVRITQFICPPSL